MIDKTDETGILVTLDQEKAFDRVDHEFLMRTLAKFGFGPSFCRWVSIFYNDVFFSYHLQWLSFCSGFSSKRRETGVPPVPSFKRAGF